MDKFEFWKIVSKIFSENFFSENIGKLFPIFNNKTNRYEYVITFHM